MMLSFAHFATALAVTAFASQAMATYYDKASLQNDQQLYADSHDGQTALVSGHYKFGLNHHGELFLESPCGSVHIASGGSSNVVAKMQSDGNFVVYNLDNGHHHPIVKYSSHTDRNHEAKLTLNGEDGSVKITATNGHVLKSYHADNSCLSDPKPAPVPAPVPVPVPAGPVCKGEKLYADMTLKRGEFLCKDGMKFGLSHDGKWLYEEHGAKTVYGSIREHVKGDIRMQTDGNLVLYEVAHEIVDICSTQTPGFHETYLCLTHDGPQIIQKVKKEKNDDNDGDDHDGDDNDSDGDDHDGDDNDSNRRRHLTDDHDDYDLKVIWSLNNHPAIVCRH